MTLLVQGQLGMKAGNKLRFEILTIAERRFCFSFAIYVGEERGSKKPGTNWEKSLPNRRGALEEEEVWFYVMNGMGFFHGSSLQFKAWHVKRDKILLSMSLEALSSSPLIFYLCTQMRTWGWAWNGHFKGTQRLVKRKGKQRRFRADIKWKTPGKAAKSTL